MKKKKGVDGKHSQWTSSSSSVLQIQSMTRCHVKGEFQVSFDLLYFPLIWLTLKVQIPFFSFFTSVEEICRWKN